MTQIYLKSIKSLKSGVKKYIATFEIITKDQKKKIKTTKFGAKGMSDYTKHKDIDRRERYINRHKKDLRTKNPIRAGFLSMYILWNKTSFKASVADYKKRLKIYNKTGKFPLTISGSKILKFGTIRTYHWLTCDHANINQFGESKIPDNVQNKSLYQRIKNKIKKDVDKKKRRWGAYDSGRLVREYKEKGGKYSGSKNKKENSDLSRWYKEKWIDACSWPTRKSCGRTQSKEKIAYCRPSVKVDSNTPKLIQDLTKAQIKSRCKKKKNNPKKILRT
tara:strand:- start:2140 stop:2967 length:828 start_codon:yes stop_codon:yes gene_type:complete